jgi:hypothetical protein
LRQAIDHAAPLVRGFGGRDAGPKREPNADRLANGELGEATGDDCKARVNGSFRAGNRLALDNALDFVIVDRFFSNGPDFEEAEAESRKRFCGDGARVEPRSKANRTEHVDSGDL